MKWDLYVWCVVGIVISVVLPLLWAEVRKYWKPKTEDVPDWRKLLKPYGVLGLASGLTAILVMMFTGDKITSAEAALLAGYAWDSTLQKLAKV